MVTRVVLKVGFGLPVTQESRTVMTCCLRTTAKSIIQELLTRRLTMATYERPVRDEYKTDSINCWL
jgi:hypothetical protein